MKIVIVVQARMTSTRLPGKVLQKVLGKTLLEYQIERLRHVRNASEIVIATTTNKTDDPIVALCKELGVKSYRGSEDDVLSRYYEAATVEKADVVVRVTSDCPLIDPVIIDEVIGKYLNDPAHYDYVSNCLVRTYPRGMDTEVFSFKALKEAHTEAKQPGEREHVTPFIRRQPSRYRIGDVLNDVDESKHRWTVDTSEDFQLIENLLKECYVKNPNYRMSDLLAAIEKNPAWFLLNHHIEQKKNLELNIAIRVDASLNSGTGHVVRMLTLAQTLKKGGAAVTFYCRAHKGHFLKQIEAQGFKAVELKSESLLEKVKSPEPQPLHIDWLTVSQEQDAEDLISALKAAPEKTDLLIVDHYALDYCWEKKLRPYTKRIFVIDDLADRKHDCDLLLDQNLILNREVAYKPLTPNNAKLLLGPAYSLLRPEFSNARNKIKAKDFNAPHIFVFFGGVDAKKLTLKSLEAFSKISKPFTADIVVSGNPDKEELLAIIAKNPHLKTHDNPKSIAELMTKATLALGAGGTTSWERCCLGLPTIAIESAVNQHDILVALHEKKALEFIGTAETVTSTDIAKALEKLLFSAEKLQAMSEICFSITDGNGSSHVLEAIHSLSF